MGIEMTSASIGPTSTDFWFHRYWLKDDTVKTWFFSEPVTCVMQTSRKGTLAFTGLRNRSLATG